MLLLTPTTTVNQIVLYSLGVAQERHPIDLYALMVEANHIHSNPGDGGSPSALPEFYRDFHALTARALNAHYGRGENFWSPGSYGNVEVHDRDTLEEQLLYTWTNPVKDGLVARPEDWPGVKFLPEDFGRTIEVSRPETAFFGGRRPADWKPTFVPVRRARARPTNEAEAQRLRRLQGTRAGALGPKLPAPEAGIRRVRRTLPERVKITISRPPGYEHLSLEEVRTHFRDLLNARVALIHQQRQAAGFESFKGPSRISRQDPLECAGGTTPTFSRNPRIACISTTVRIGLLTDLSEWRREYRSAFQAWVKGDRSTLFPAGSYALPRWHGAQARAPTRSALCA